MGDVAIRVVSLGKQYRIGSAIDPNRTLAETIADTLKTPFRTARSWLRPNEADTIWALRDVSFEVKKGQVLGVVGANGAGKSTLLKILTRITLPTTGYAQVYGRVGSLLEVGTGFHPELTGRENVYLNGAILGMRKREIERRFDEIVAFSGVERFIDTPVKRYSSGMKVRLAFSVAAHLEPEVLLVDEVLAVGDAEFRAKCLGKMKDVSGEGRTVLFVTHSMTILQQLCPEAILLDHGQLTRRGETSQIVREYLGGRVEDEAEKVWVWRDSRPEYFVPLRLRILDADGTLTNHVRSSEPFYVEIEYEITQQMQGLHLGISLSTGQGEIFCTAYNKALAYELEPGLYVARCEIPPNLFNHGGFILGIITSLPGQRQRLYRDFELLNLYIDGSTVLSDLGRAILLPAFAWETRPAERIVAAAGATTGK